MAFTVETLRALDTGKPLSSFETQTWQTDSGLPQNTVHAILQTHDGYLWLGTEGGLVRFDGVKFTLYDAQNTSALHSNVIRALIEDREKSLWIGTADGLTVFKQSGAQVFTREAGLPANSIWSIYQDHSGRLWVNTAEGLAEYHAGRFEAHLTEKKATGNGAIAEDSHGNLLLGTPTGVRIYRDGVFAQAKDLPVEPVDALLSDTRGRLWIGTRGGLYVSQDGMLRRADLSRRILSLAETLDGSILAGYDGGVARFTDKTDILSLPGDGVLALFEDREGNQWIGTETGGVTVLRPQKFVTYGQKEGLANDLVRCVFEDRRGAMWFGTNGGVTRLQDAKLTSFTTQDGLSSNVVFSLGQTPSGDLLVGTQDGLNILHDGKFELLTTADGLPDDLIRSIFTDSQGTVWIGTRRGLTAWRDAKFRTYTAADGLGSDLVGALLQDRAGNLWIGTRHGLTELKDRVFKTYGAAVVTAVYEDSEGGLWVGTEDGGLNRLQDGKLVPVAGPPAAIFSIVEGGDSIWVTTKTGVYRINRPSNQVVQYTTADGLRVSECSEGGHPAAWRDSHGALWFATLRGVSQILPPAMLTGPPPKVVIEGISLDDRPFDFLQDNNIPPKYSRLSLQYTGISFVSPQRVRFRYRLDGFDKDWVDAGTRRVAYYTSLPPGTYTFHVSARTNDGDWTSQEAAYTLRLLPRFYQTYWFYLLLLATAALLAYAIYRWRVREVEARFTAVLAERNRIAREIHDTLAQGFVAISLQLEMLSRKLDHPDQTVRDLLKQARETVQSSLTEARRSIWELRSEGGETNDLRSRLSKLTSTTAAKSGLKVQFQVLGAFRALPPKVDDEIVKITQEALANVVRHAAAKNVQVALAYQPGKVKLTIEDDGRGFSCAGDAVSPPGHYGLSGMRERAMQIGANLTVKSSEGCGTRIEVEKIVS